VADDKRLGGDWYAENPETRARFRLKKVEKKLLLRLAKRRFHSGNTGKPSVGQAVAYLLRVAFKCLGEHVPDPGTYKASPLDPREIDKAMRDQGVSVVTRDGLRKPRIKTINPDGSTRWDVEGG